MEADIEALNSLGVTPSEDKDVLAGQVAAINAVSLFNQYGNGGYRAWTGGPINADKRHDIYSIGGYPDYIPFREHLNMYARTGPAKQGIDLDVDKTWQTWPRITDGDDKDTDAPKTPFEKDLEFLIEERDLFHRLKELDRKSMVGRYGVLRIVARELNKNAKPDEQLKLSDVRQIYKLIPIYEDEAEVTTWDDNFNSPEYGEPKVYQIQTSVSGNRDEGQRQSFMCHPSRVIAWGGALDGSIYGIPANEAGFNHLMNMMKVETAFGEGGFRQAKGQQVHSIKDDRMAQMLRGDSNAPQRKQYNENVDKWQKGFDTVLNVAGVDVQQLQMTLSNPQQIWEMSANSYAASRNIPFTILFGQQTGRLASDEDQSHYGQKIMSRRTNETDTMIKQVLRHLIKVGALSAPNDKIVIEWDDITEPSQRDKLEMAEKATIIAKNQADSMGQLGDKPIITGDEIRKDILGYEDEPEMEIDDFAEDDNDDQ